MSAINMFNSCMSSPVFYGQDFRPNVGSASNASDFDVRLSHPACYGFQKEVKKEPTTKQDEEMPKKDRRKATQSSAREYLEEEIFPVLLPALEEMLQAAKKNDVLKWKRTKFNACDYLTEYLYNNNPRHQLREKSDLWEIPFVQRINAEKPRPPLPLSLLLTDEEAATIIQSFWRGCKVRMDSEVQELRQYQKEMREQEYDIMLKVEDFWKKHKIEDEPDDL